MSPAATKIVSTVRAVPVDPAVAIEYDVDDGDIYRVGAEYIHPLDGIPDGVIPVSLHGRRHVSIWGGWYRTPDDRIRMTRFNSTDPDVNTVYLEAFGGGDEEDHFTTGVGYTTGRSRLQIAADFSDEGNQVVGSYIITLGRGGK